MATETVHHAATLADHLPILQVLVPFLAAPIVVVLGSRALAWPLAFASSLICTIIAFLLLMQVMDGSFISYHLGGWAPPLGIEYRVDAANAFVLLLVRPAAAQQESAVTELWVFDADKDEANPFNCIGEFRKDSRGFLSTGETVDPPNSC